MPRRHDTFCALDFETSSPARTSACALAIVRVQGGRIVGEWSSLIRPPDGVVWRRFEAIHGISSDDVADAPSFAQAWRQAKPLLRGARFLAAHNAGFDRSVLRASCEAYEVPAPRKRFVCTVKLARDTWGIRPTRLPNVCEHLGIPLLRHHDALQDARACAEIVIRAHREDLVEPMPRQAVAVLS